MQALSGIGHKPILCIAVSLFVILISACAGKPDSEMMVFKSLDESLVNSNMTINRSTETILMSLQEKTTDPATSYKAETWLPKAMLIQKLSSAMVGYIENLKSDLKKEAGTEIDGHKLYDRLSDYKKNIFAIDSQMTNVFENTIALLTPVVDSAANKQERLNDFLAAVPMIAKLAFLNEFQNNIRNMENRMIQFCNNKISIPCRMYDVYSAIVAQNTNYVIGGDNIEIYAGMGAFTQLARPEVTIYGKLIPLGAEGFATYKFKAANKAGKHLVPVKINYRDQDGKKQTIEKVIEYTVAAGIQR